MLMFIYKWMQPETIRLNDLSQTQKCKYQFFFSFTDRSCFIEPIDYFKHEQDILIISFMHVCPKKKLYEVH